MPVHLVLFLEYQRLSVPGLDCGRGYISQLALAMFKSLHHISLCSDEVMLDMAGFASMNIIIQN